MFRDLFNALEALSRLGRSQLVLVFFGAVVSVVLTGISTSWGGSAFFATVAFLLADIVNALYSITYENTFAFSALAVLLVEQNIVVTASAAVGILEDFPASLPSWFPWVSVAVAWFVLALLLLLQLLRQDWGWHAHKLGLARTEDVALYRRIQQLEGAVLLDFSQVVPTAVILLGKYGFSVNVREHVKKTTENGGTDKLAQVVTISIFLTAIISVLMAPVLIKAARQEHSAVFYAASAMTLLTSAAIILSTVDAIRRVCCPIEGSDAILVAMLAVTCAARLVLMICIARIPQSVFGSGISVRINRGADGVLLPSNIEGWSECRRSGFTGVGGAGNGGGGGHSTLRDASSNAETEGAGMLYGNNPLDDNESDCESDINFAHSAAAIHAAQSYSSSAATSAAAGSSMNPSSSSFQLQQGNSAAATSSATQRLVYGEQVSARPSAISNNSLSADPVNDGLTSTNNNNNNYGARRAAHQINGSGTSMSSFKHPNSSTNNSSKYSNSNNNLDDHSQPLLAAASAHNQDGGGSETHSNLSETTGTAGGGGGLQDDVKSSVSVGGTSATGAPRSPNRQILHVKAQMRRKN